VVAVAVRFPEPVVIVRGPTRDAHGDPVAGSETRRTQVWGAFEFSGTSEDTTSRGATVSTPARLYLPYGTEVTRTDRVEVRGRTWEVDGDPEPWQSPLTSTRGVTQVNLRSVRG
jgi:head-tail adaptor